MAQVIIPGPAPAHSGGRMWSLGWVVIIRLILYLVIVGFLLQYIYFEDSGRYHRPGRSIAEMAVVFLLGLVILALGARSRILEQLIAFTYVLDIGVITEVGLASGGYNSVFVPFYLPVLVMASAQLPRRLTAVFPSMAALGLAYIGYAHLLVAYREVEEGSSLFAPEILRSLRFMEAHTVVSTMLVLVVLFFIVSYLAGVLSERLSLEQRLNSAVLSSMSEGVAVVNARGAAAYVNGEFRRLFPGARAGERILPTLRGMLGPDAEEKLAGFFRRDGGESSLLFNRECLSENGRSPLSVRVSGIRLPGADGLYGLLFLVSDLTLSKRMEKAERSLERVSAVSTMATGLAHEIRNPLASLRSAIQEVGTSFPEGSQNRMLTEVVLSESDRLDRVIGRFLDFSREGRLRLRHWRIRAILREVTEMVSRDDAGKRMRINLLPGADPTVMCDADRLKEVFFNLAVNAAQMTPPPDGVLDISVGNEERDGQAGVEVCFRDNGPGIPEKDREHLFEPFFSTRGGGTGMGLALSRKQISMHGGEIEALPGLERGACFRVWLPLEQMPESRGSTRIGR